MDFKQLYNFNARCSSSKLIEDDELKNSLSNVRFEHTFNTL